MERVGEIESFNYSDDKLFSFEVLILK